MTDDIIPKNGLFNVCPFRDVFGQAGKGVHSYRVLDVAIVDVVLTVIVGYLLAWGLGWNAVYTIAGLFLLGVFFHRLFYVRTTVDKLLFSGPR